MCVFLQKIQQHESEQRMSGELEFMHDKKRTEDTKGLRNGEKTIV